ncbi:helix-turn-helix domain-containing protein [Glutamicibacter sp. NPDC087344]|uniref:helix-turn-helix domain-containing protein n=1 Tax=Glutamicibacter sp. NPDC087344 TaxID=3363994 RepID=UPI0037F25DD6
MSENWKVETGQRVRARVKLLGLLQKDVAHQVGMTEDSFSRALSGSRQFSLVEISALSEFLHVSIKWLLTGERDRFEVKLSARHEWNSEQKQDKPLDWSSASSITNVVANLYGQVEIEAAEKSKVSVPENSPVETARWARSRMSAQQRVLDADGEVLSELIEMTFGIDVLVIDPPKIFDAYSGDSGGNKFIVQSTTGNGWRARFNIIHELGHILHGDLGYPDEPRAVRADEAWANAFAAEWLMPEDEILSFDWREASRADFISFVGNLGVSTKALAVRVQSLNLRPNEEILNVLASSTPALLKEGRSPFWSHELERHYRAQRFPARLIAAHQAAVAQGKLAPSSLAWMLGVNESEVSTSAPATHSLTAQELAELL